MRGSALFSSPRPTSLVELEQRPEYPVPAPALGAPAAWAESGEVTVGYQLIFNPWKVAIAGGDFEKATGYKINWRKFDSPGKLLPAITSGDVQIAIEVQDDAERPGRKTLLGLVIGAEPAGMQAHLWQDERRIVTIPVDELGNFVIPDLAPGVYELIVGGPEVEVHVQELQVCE